MSGYIAQLANQVAIVTELAKLVKAGEYVGGLGKPDAVVLVGHSFGSVISLNAVAERPELVDGVVLTGFSLNSTYLNHNGFVEGIALRVASGQQPERWGKLDTVSCCLFGVLGGGVLTGVRGISRQRISMPMCKRGFPWDLFFLNAEMLTGHRFFKAPDYAHEVAEYADATKTPFAATELVEDKNVVAPPYAFKGAAMVFPPFFFSPPSYPTPLTPPDPHWKIRLHFLHIRVSASPLYLPHPNYTPCPNMQFSLAATARSKPPEGKTSRTPAPSRPSATPVPATD